MKKILIFALLFLASCVRDGGEPVVIGGNPEVYRETNEEVLRDTFYKEFLMGNEILDNGSTKIPVILTPNSISLNGIVGKITPSVDLKPNKAFSEEKRSLVWSNSISGLECPITLYFEENELLGVQLPGFLYLVSGEDLTNFINTKREETPSGQRKTKIYTVQAYDTAEGIAKKHGMTYKELRALNTKLQIHLKSYIREGWKLVVYDNQ